MEEPKQLLKNTDIELIASAYPSVSDILHDDSFSEINSSPFVKARLKPFANTL
jgi:hypothetical protein